MRGSRVAREDVALTLSHLATLTEAALPPAEALALLTRHAEAWPLRAALRAASGAVQRGTGLVGAAVGLTSAPEFAHRFAEAAGARGVGEAEVLRGLAQHERQAPDIRLMGGGDGLLFACYLVVACVVWLFMGIFVLPTFATMYRSLGAELPLLTRAILAIQDWVGRWLVVLIVLVAALYVLRDRVGLIVRARAAVSATIPPLRQAVRLASACEYLNALATLCRANFPLAEAHPIATAAVGNAVWRDRLARAGGDGARPGASLAEALRERARIPPRLAGVLEVAERSGRPEQTLAESGAELEDYAATRLARTRQMVRVVTLLLIGTLVGLTVIGFYLPIFNLVTLVK